MNCVYDLAEPGASCSNADYVDPRLTKIQSELPDSLYRKTEIFLHKSCAHH